MIKDFFIPIKNESAVAKLFNAILKELTTARIISAPRTFEDINREDAQRFTDLFYESCLWEMYLHDTVKGLYRWKDTTELYLNEFNGKWAYYAASKRLESIKKYGGEESDYDEDGSMKTSVNDEELSVYSVIYDLVPDGIRDIFIDTTPRDLHGLYTALATCSNMCISDVFAKMGKSIPTYRKDANGNMVEMTFADKALHKVVEQHDAELLASLLHVICTFIQHYVEEMRKLDRKSDNKEFFKRMLTGVQNLIDVNFEMNS